MAGARLPRRGCGERQENMSVVSIISSPVVGLEEREPAFLQDADGGGVVFGDAGVEGTALFPRRRKAGSASVARQRPTGDSRAHRAQES